MQLCYVRTIDFSPKAATWEPPRAGSADDTYMDPSAPGRLESAPFFAGLASSGLITEGQATG